MRLALFAAVLLLPPAALAQTPELDRWRLHQLQQDNMRAQEQANALSRAQADLNQATADLRRAQSEANLRSLGTPPPLSSWTEPRSGAGPGSSSDSSQPRSNAASRAGAAGS